MSAYVDLHLCPSCGSDAVCACPPACHDCEMCAEDVAASSPCGTCDCWCDEQHGGRCDDCGRCSASEPPCECEPLSFYDSQQAAWDASMERMARRYPMETAR